LSPSFGHTCAGRARRATLLALLLVAPSLQSGYAAAFAASTDPTQSIPLSLGFGPSSLSPVSNGVPIYAVWDTMWAASGFNQTVTLSVTSPSAGPAAPSTVIKDSLSPRAIAPLHTFTPSDTDGVWNITVGSQQGTFVIPVHFLNTVQHRRVLLGPLQYSLDAGNITISAQASLGDSYDQEVCAVGNGTGGAIGLSLPRDMGDVGRVSLVPGNPFTVTVSGRVSGPSSFWFELYHPYGLEVASANSVVSDNLMTAESQPVALASNATLNTTLTWNMAPREGRYELRAYFQNSTSLEVVQSRVLVIFDSYWVSLSESCKPLSIQSQSISYSTSLANGQDNWPRSLYVMYRTFGVESVDSYPVEANVSSVNFVASPWNQPLQGVEVNVSPATGILQTSQDGGSLFVLASRYPVRVDYSLDMGGLHDLAMGSFTVDARYETQTTELDTAKLTIRVLADQSSPVAVVVAGPQGVSVASGPVGGNRTSTFLLPAGSYTLTASQGGGSQSAQVGLTDGVATSVTLNLNAFPTLEVILVVTAVVAAFANVLVWVVRPRGLSSKLASR
jgi:hypothetical protein